MSSKYSIGEMNQLADAFEKACFTSDDVTKLKQYKDLTKIKQVLNGYAEVIPISHIINCDIVPEILSGWRKEEHRKMGKVNLENRDGKLYANGQEVIRFLSKKQKNGKVIIGHNLRQELASKTILNACILDYLLKCPKLIPKEWKKDATYFWGTIFRDSNGELFVAYLDYSSGEWGWDYCWIGSCWHGFEFAACLDK